MAKDPLLAAALRAPRKQPLLQHRESVRVLRLKGYTWREVAEFLAEQGVSTDHTTLFRLFKGVENMTKTITVPNARSYSAALQKIGVNKTQRAMLLAHYASHNRSITYTDLAKSAGFSDHSVANLEYGKLGRKLGEQIGFEFDESDARPGETFYSSSLGMPNPYTSGEFQLVMHHELAKAIEELHWT